MTDDTFENSSFGTAGAKALRARTPRSMARIWDIERRGTQLVQIFEKHRGALLFDGPAGRDHATRQLLKKHGGTFPDVSSADLISCAPTAAGGDRIIEIKAYGGTGPISLSERELATYEASGDLAWIYVVFNLTQPHPVELWLIKDPARLPWARTQPVARDDNRRNARNTLRLQIPAEVIRGHATAGSLADLGDLPSWCAAAPD